PIGAIHSILPTHAHPDHTGMANGIREQSGAEIYLHASELGFIDYRRSDSSSELLHGWLLRYGVPPDEAADMVARVREGDKATPALKPTRVLEGGEEVAVGSYRFEAHWTPGHTPGHVCFYEPERRMLMSGDHILQDVAPNVSLQPFTDENPMPGYISSLQWMADMPIEVTLPGHGSPFPSPRERALALVSHQLDRQAHLRTLLTKQPQTAWQLAEQVWADSKPNTWRDFQPRLRRNAMATLAAHLELLVGRGEAERIDDGVVAYARVSSEV
ncbi:MAG TPA: MBL fold metallo-hydrolase, partial [Chloroflexota bacterium]